MGLLGNCIVTLRPLPLIKSVSHSPRTAQRTRARSSSRQNRGRMTPMPRHLRIMIVIPHPSLDRQCRTCNFGNAPQAVFEPRGRGPGDRHGALQRVRGRPARAQLVGDSGEEAVLGEHRSRSDVVQEKAAGAVTEKSSCISFELHRPHQGSIFLSHPASIQTSKLQGFTITHSVGFSAI